jgi:predicted metal-dependent hydrolase
MPDDDAVARGVMHFNARRFFEAHEAWEELWLGNRSELSEFLRGLIQLAAAYHHLQRGTFRGAVRLFDAALERLSRYPPNYAFVAREEAERAAREHRQWAAGVLALHARDVRMFEERIASYPLLGVVVE